MSPAIWVMLAVCLQRAVELPYARANASRLLSQGARESSPGHYPILMLFHASWLAALFALAFQGAQVHWGLLLFYGVLQLLRLWTIASLGRHWTTRIITLPGMPLTRRGPYRFMRHPNYAIVCAELAVLPWALGSWKLAGVFSILHLPLLAHRIRCEERALAAARAFDSPNHL